MKNTEGAKRFLHPVVPQSAPKQLLLAGLKHGSCNSVQVSYVLCSNQVVKVPSVASCGVHSREFDIGSRTSMEARHSHMGSDIIFS